MKKKTSYTKPNPPRRVADSALVNQAIGLGTQSDRLQFTMYSPSRQSDKDVYELYQYNALATRIVENLAGDTTKAWRYLESSNDRIVLLLNEKDTDLQLQELSADVTRELMMFGVCYVIMYTNNSEALDAPLMNTEELRRVFVLPRNVVTESAERVSEFNEFFNTPLFYTIARQVSAETKVMERIHYTRIIKITDSYKSPFDTNINTYTGTLNKVYKDIIGYCAIIRAIETLIQDSSIGILQSQGMHQLLAQPNGISLVNEYFADAMRNKSLFRTTIIDAQDKLTRLEVGNLASIATALDKHMEFICANTNQSMKRLFGLQAKGMSNDTNVDDGWLAYVKSWQQNKLNPMLTRIATQILAYNKTSGDYTIIWNAVEEQSEKEESEALKLLTDSLTALVANNIILESRAAQTLANSGYLEIPDDEIEAVAMNAMTESELNNGDTGSVSTPS